MNPSWRTTVAGISAIVAAVGGALQAMLDGNPATSPDWNTVVVAVVAGLGLVFARDNRVTSEKAGAR